MNAEQTEAIGRRFADLFNQHDLSIADELFGPNFKSLLPQAPTVLDKEGWKAYIQVFFTGFPDLYQDTEDMIATDNHLVLQLMYHGTHQGHFQGLPPTGKSIHIRAIGVNRIENGFIVENTVTLDMLSVMQQISAITPARSGEQHLQAIYRLQDDAIHPGNFDLMDNLTAQDYVQHNPLGRFDREQATALLRGLHSAFSGFTLAREQAVSDSDFVATRIRISGIFERELASATGPIPPTHKPIHIDILNMFRFDQEGKIAEEWAQFDNLGFLTQLGVMPATT